MFLAKKGRPTSAETPGGGSGSVSGDGASQALISVGAGPGRRRYDAALSKTRHDPCSLPRRFPRWPSRLRSLTVREILDEGPRDSSTSTILALAGNLGALKNHSERSACMTSTRAARAAGSIEATTAAPISTNAETITGNAPGIFKSPK